MKKLLGPLVSIFAGALTFLFLSLPHYVIKSKTVIGDGVSRSNAWEIMKDMNKDVDGSLMFYVTTIILIVVASILVLFGLIYLLNNLKAIKSKANLKIVADVLLIAFVVVVVLQLIALFTLCKAYSGNAFGLVDVATYPSVGAWLSVILAALACLVSIFLTKPIKKRK